jgi:hypothetical protein
MSKKSWHSIATKTSKFLFKFKGSKVGDIMSGVLIALFDGAKQKGLTEKDIDSYISIAKKVNEIGYENKIFKKG